VTDEMFQPDRSEALIEKHIFGAELAEGVDV